MTGADVLSDDRVPAFSAFASPQFRYYAIIRMAGGAAENMLAVGVGWQVYDITRDPFYLGAAGLLQYLPRMLFVLPAGQLADRFDRRVICGLGFGLELLATLILVALAAAGGTQIVPIMTALVAFGAGQALSAPPIRAMLPLVVPRAHLNNAVTWNSSLRQGMTMIAPVFAGFLYAFGTVYVFAVTAAMVAISLAAATQLPGHDPARNNPILGKPTPTAGMGGVLSGLRYVWSEPIILGAMSLDLFAVLLGGATALLPVYARTILSIGPIGLGMLRGAPAVGAALATAYLVLFPLRRRVGVTMLAFVAGFGASTVVFGVSTNLALSLIALGISGLCNTVAVNVRQTMLQLLTPDAMRGRMGAVNELFLGASNQLGEFESGVTAAWFGTVQSVVAGGVGTLLIVAIWTRKFAEITRVDRFGDL